MYGLRNLAAVALAFASVSFAAECDEDFMVRSDGDIAQLSSCSTFKGKLVLGENVTQIILPTGMHTIAGDLICQGAEDLTSLSGPSLRTIGGQFNLKGLIRLSSLSFPMLSSVKTVAWETLPNLRSLDFTTEITQAESVSIENTILTSLQGINLVQAKRFRVTNNKYLKEVKVNLGNVTDILDVNFNAKGVIASFPELRWAQNISLGDAGSASFPKLEEVKSSISFVNNTLQEIYLPKLGKVGQSFAVVSCSSLTNLTVPSLVSVGGTFQIANNTMLGSVTGFPKLKTVGGAVDLSGNFKEAALPALDDVSGGFNLQSTDDLDCTGFDKLKGGVVRGKYVCKSNLDEAESSTGGAGTKGDGKGGKDDDKKDAAASVVVNFGIMAVVGAAALWVM